MLFTGDPFLTKMYAQMIMSVNAQKVQRTAGAYQTVPALNFNTITKNFSKERDGLRYDPNTNSTIESVVNSGTGYVRGVTKSGFSDGWATPLQVLHKQPADYMARQASLVQGAMSRYFDDIFFERIDGSTKTGANADVDFPLANRSGKYNAATNKLEVMSWEEILEVQTDLQELEVGEDENFMGGMTLAPYVAFLSPRKILEFLKNDKFINRDFGAMGLVTGTVDSFLGVEFRRHNSSKLHDDTEYYWKDGYGSPKTVAAAGYEQVDRSTAKVIFTTRDALEIGEIAGAGANAVWQDMYNTGAMRSFTSFANYHCRGIDDKVKVFHTEVDGRTSLRNVDKPKKIAGTGIAEGYDLFSDSSRNPQRD